MVVLSATTGAKEQNGLIVLHDKMRTEATCVAAGNKSAIKPGDTVVFNPDLMDAYDAEQKLYFIKDFKVTAVIR